MLRHKLSEELKGLKWHFNNLKICKESYPRKRKEYQRGNLSGKPMKNNRKRKEINLNTVHLLQQLGLSSEPNQSKTKVCEKGHI